MKIEEIKKRLETAPCRSAWKKGVRAYAFEMLENIQEGYIIDAIEHQNLKDLVLSGADDFQDLSSSARYFVFDGDIANRLCNPSELKRYLKYYGEPNRRENWIDVQARALEQAYRMISDAIAEGDLK